MRPLFYLVALGTAALGVMACSKKVAEPATADATAAPGPSPAPPPAPTPSERSFATPPASAADATAPDGGVTAPEGGTTVPQGGPPPVNTPPQ